MTSGEKNSVGLWGWSLAGTILTLSLLWFGGLLGFYGYNEEGLRHLIRWSARLSLSLFCLAFAARGIHLLLRNSFTFWILMNRKYLGISFAFIHLIHLAFLLLLQAHFHPVFDLAKSSSLLAGGLAYLFVVLMLLTSFPYFSCWLSRQNWKRLHTIGGYWIWTIFMTSYWKRVLTEPDYLAPALLLVAVFFIRMYTLYKSKRSVSLQSEA